MDYDTCYANAVALVQLSSALKDRNEAQTRFDIIDSLLLQCLGWDRENCKVEEPHGEEYADYVLGSPRRLIVEAKREGIYFEIPPENEKLIQSLKQIAKLSKANRSALEQVQAYCSRRGVRYAAVCNGQQLIAFVATRQDGIDPLEGKCLVINGLEQLVDQFARVHGLLSQAAIETNKLSTYLRAGEAVGTPRKLSAQLMSYPAVRQRTDFQANLKIISDLVLEDILGDEAIERKFYEECYCEAGALSQHALVSKKILAARYAALFDPTEPTPALHAIGKKKKGRPDLSDEVLALAASKRPIVLIGDVGVGKTSFIKHLIYVTAKDEFADALFVYIDLGRQGTLSSDIKEFVLDEVESQLLAKYDVDITAASFVFAVCHSEVGRFRKTMDGDLEASNPALYKERLRDHLKGKLANRAEHLRRAVEHIASGRKEQVVIAVDNADQRSVEVQQEAFVISQEIAAKWNSIVFIAVRPHTFYQSKRAGALSAYPTKAFTISPPRIDLVLEKRLSFALEMATGKVPVEKLRGVSFSMTSLAFFLKSLLHSLSHNDGLVTLIDNISGGNVRTSVELVTKYIGSPNADSERIVQEMEAGQNYLIPVHDFARSILYGEYVHYVPHASMAFNLFDVDSPDPREHFLACLVLEYLQSDSASPSHEGFVSTEGVFSEMQAAGFSVSQIEGKLRRLTNKKLIETTERITFEEDVTGLIGEMPSAFRATTVGVYHVTLWSADFAYLDAMLIDTPCFDEAVRSELGTKIYAHDLSTRIQRSLCLREYLSSVWRDFEAETDYFNWEDCVTACQPSFDRVSAFLERARLNSSR